MPTKVAILDGIPGAKDAVDVVSLYLRMSVAQAQSLVRYLKDGSKAVSTCELEELKEFKRLVQFQLRKQL